MSLEDVHTIRLLNSLKSVYFRSVENNIDMIKKNNLSVQELVECCAVEIKKAQELTNIMYTDKNELKIVLESYLAKTLKILSIVYDDDFIL